MNYHIHETNGKLYLELSSSEVLTNLQDYIDLLGNALFNQVEVIILKQSNLPENFFDLKNRFAGEVLQKFSNYRQSLIVVADLSEIKNQSLKDFIRESNKTGLISFVNSIDEVILN